MVMEYFTNIIMGIINISLGYLNWWIYKRKDKYGRHKMNLVVTLICGGYGIIVVIDSLFKWAISLNGTI